MPKYEYACKSCGEHLEAVQSFADAPLTECPACGGPLRKVFSPPGIAFKGSGFYRTDNRKRRQDPKVEANGAKTDGAKVDGAKVDAKAGAGTSSDSKSGDSKSGDSKSGSSADGSSKKEPAPAPAAKAAEAKTA